MNSQLRRSRLDSIRQILLDEVIEGQDELALRLTALGYSCTQSSVSRDLQSLGAYKAGGRYVLSPIGGQMEIDILGATCAGPHLIVVKTAIGAAPRVALHLDALADPDVVGTIAGDDTIFVAVPNQESQARLLRKWGHQG